MGHAPEGVAVSVAREVEVRHVTEGGGGKFGQDHEEKRQFLYIGRAY